MTLETEKFAAVPPTWKSPAATPETASLKTTVNVRPLFEVVGSSWLAKRLGGSVS